AGSGPRRRGHAHGGGRFPHGPHHATAALVVGLRRAARTNPALLGPPDPEPADRSTRSALSGHGARRRAGARSVDRGRGGAATGGRGGVPASSASRVRLDPAFGIGGAFVSVSSGTGAGGRRCGREGGGPASGNRGVAPEPRLRPGTVSHR